MKSIREMIVERRQSALHTPSPPQSPAHRAKSPNGIIGTCIPSCLTDSTESTLVAHHLLLTHVTQHDLHKRVVIAGVKRGVLKYFGRTHFQEGIWCGVQLDDPEGKHNGQVHGVQYFECDYDKGVFAPLHKVALELQPEKPEEEGLATSNTLKRQNTFTIDDEERSKRSSVEGQNSVVMESHTKKRPATAPGSRRTKTGQQPLGSPKVLDSTYAVKTGSPKRANKNQGPTNPTTHHREHQKTIQRKASLSGVLVKGRRNSPEMDESLGILSPTEMQGLPSLSTSICSNFAWETPRSPEELNATSQLSGATLQDVSMSTPHEKTEILSPRLSLSPIKTFSLDSEKIKAIESITIDDPEPLKPTTTHSNFHQNLPVERKLKGYDNECDLLFARTEQLLQSCRQKREKAQQLEISALSLLEERGDLTTVKVSNQTVIQPGNETIIQPCNETVIQQASDTMILPGNETMIQPSDKTTIIESSNDAMVIEDIDIPVDFDGPQADPDSTFTKDQSNATFHNNNETLNLCPKDIFDTTKALPSLEVRVVECPRSFIRVMDADCMISSKTDSIDTGLGSMPSSMISMATSQDLHSDMETSVSESLSNRVYEQKISPISEREETPSTDLDITLKLADISIEPPENPCPTETSEPSSESTSELPPITKRKHSENGHLGVEKPALKRNRSAEKGLATKRSELLTKERIMPKTNVPSKLKAMLETNKEVAAENPRKKREKKAGRWDEIMKNIAESQKQTMSQVKKTKEVKSKVFEGFKPPPMARNRSNLGSNRSLASRNDENLERKSTDFDETPSVRSRSNSKSSVYSTTSVTSSASKRTSSADLLRSNSVLSEISNRSETQVSQRTNAKNAKVASTGSAQDSKKTIQGVPKASKRPPVNPPRPASKEGSNTPTTTPTYERQVKSLTPERDLHRLGGTGLRSSNPAIRKVSASSARPLLHAKNNREQSVTSVKSAKSAKPSDRVTSNNAKNSHSSTITVKTKDLRSNTSGQTSNGVSRTRKISPSSNTNNATNPVNSGRVGAKKSKDNSKDRIQNRSSSTTTTATATRYHQPDLVKVGSEFSSVEAKEREIQNLRSQVRHNAKAFDALSITFDYLANKIGGLEAPVLRQQLEDLKSRLEGREKDFVQLTNQRAHDLDTFRQETNQQKANTDLLIQEFDSKVAKVKQQHRTLLEKAQQEHKEAIEHIIETRINDLTEQDERHEHEIKGHQNQFKAQLEELEAKWQEKLLSSLEEKQEEMRKVDLLWQSKEEKWQESKRSLEDQIHTLQNEIKEHEALSRAKNKGDLQLQAVHNKIEKVNAEAESLKAVLELKTREVHVLRNEKVRLEEKLEEFDRVRLELSKASAIVEDLKAQVAKKTNVERKLSAENRKLYSNIERESCEKKRLSMENEELHWKIRQSMDGLSLSTVEGPSSGQSSLSEHYEGLNKLSCSFTEGCSKSLPPFMGRITNRPFQLHTSEYGPISESSASSADSGADFDVFDPRSLPNQGRACAAGMEAAASDSVPDSPRVLEVVKKTESVAWKLEYDELMGVFPPCYTPSPNLSRKISPKSASRSMENVHMPDHLALSRKKAVHTFEPVRESSEPIEGQSPQSMMIMTPTTPDPVNISGDFDDIGSEISSSSEIEIEDQPQNSEGGLSSPEETVEEVSQIFVAHQVQQIRKNPMNCSLPSYDLQNLFCPQPKDSGGESMMADPEDPSEFNESSGDEECSMSPGESNLMSDSLSAVSWSEECE
ncbi:restin homolog isoform X3 [Tigriopus californicus]|uniref:restin homolog isoform X3 n=1 Tax=Tigriopus californicus TaxID=6832 RepID=UPI0027DA4191|nr:restin homolog isoform X3 [Tigriopus californicus]